MRKAKEHYIQYILRQTHETCIYLMMGKVNALCRDVVSLYGIHILQCDPLESFVLDWVG